MADESNKQDVVLSVRVPRSLGELIEYVADQRGMSVDDAVNKMLEEIVETERIRRIDDDDAKLEWKALGDWFGRGKKKRTAVRVAAAAREARLVAWREWCASGKQGPPPWNRAASPAPPSEPSEDWEKRARRRRARQRSAARKRKAKAT